MSNHDMDQLPAFKRVWELVGSETVTYFVRVVAAVLSVGFATMAYGPLFQYGSPGYENPIFDGVFSFASPAAWATGFLTCSALMFLTAFTARAVIYTVAVVVSTFTLGAWASMIVYESWRNPDAFLNAGVYGLYLFSFTSIVGLALSPGQLARKPAVVLVTNDHEVVATRRIGA